MEVAMINITVPKSAAAVIDALAKNGCEAYAVGGCVRDALLGREPNDWDVTTSAKPEAVLKIFSEREGFHAIPTGIEHGTVTVVSGDEPIEVTTFRIDGEYSDSRHPDSVEFTDDLTADLARRDFTVNAMAYSPECGLVDVYGGVRDLEVKVIRCVGNPRERFSEDALRIMRAIRFAAQLGFDIDRDTATAARELAPTLGNIAKERITAELSKLLVGRYASRVMSAHSDILAQVLPMLDKSAILSAGERISLISDASLPVYVAALLADAPDDAVGELFKRLRFDNKAASAVKAILENKNVQVGDKIDIKRLCKSVGSDTARDVITLKSAMGESVDVTLGLVDEIVKNDECFSLAKLEIDGRELLSLGFVPTSIGKTLDALLEDVISGKLNNNKNDLKNAAIRILKG